jgi:hypothetical protein
MAISEESRHEMYVKLEEVLGARVAATMMEHLPPVGWADVATKRDLELLKLDIRSELQGQINRLLLWLFPSMVTLVGLAFAAGKFA